MARSTKVITTLTDDLNGGEAQHEVRFSLQGVEYEIDLNEKNFAALQKALQKYVDAGRKVPPRRAKRPSKAPRPLRAAAGREDQGAIREWAKSQGMTVAERGRIPKAVREAYAAAG